MEAKFHGQKNWELQIHAKLDYASLLYSSDLIKYTAYYCQSYLGQKSL